MELADTASLRAQITNLQEELDLLRARYDTLLESKNRAAERYKADYKKWRDFKRWLFPDAETDDDIKSLLKNDESLACVRASALGKRKQFEDLERDLDAEDVDHQTEDLEQTSLKSDSFWSPVASKYQRRKSYHGESPSRALSSSPGGNQDPFLAPQHSNYDDKSSVLNPKSGGADLFPNKKYRLKSFAEVPCKAEPSRQIPQTEPRKGRGRYAQVSSGIGTINARFSIRKDRNNGVDFQYEAVVRNQQERKHMLGGDCECCRDYYEAVGPLPASRQPLWRTPTKRKPSQNYPASDNDKENGDEVEEHKQRISRHRHHWHRPKTPPGYWDIGFPDTQEVLDINRRAAEMHKRKLVEVESEARNNNGRYIERAQRAH